MISDEERREVARRLREIGEELGSSVLLWYHIAKILGVRTATDGKTACDMLADLIDPGHDHFADATKMVDRGALLELADEMEDDASYLDKHPYSFTSPSDFRDYAERIREACGEGER